VTSFFGQLHCMATLRKPFAPAQFSANPRTNAGNVNA